MNGNLRLAWRRSLARLLSSAFPTSNWDILRRFLDVTKAALLFARGVILVEGVAEQLLIPVIAKRIGRPLARHGVTVINIGGVAFEPFVELFAEDRLPYRCAVVSDSDPSEAPPEPERRESLSVGTGENASGEGEPAIPARSPRAAALATREGGNVRVRLAQKTLEWDLVIEGNWEWMLDALEPLKPVVAGELRDDADAGVDERADELLAKVKDVKGQFAQELADLLESDPDGKSGTTWSSGTTESGSPSPAFRSEGTAPSATGARYPWESRRGKMQSDWARSRP